MVWPEGLLVDHHRSFQESLRARIVTLIMVQHREGVESVLVDIGQVRAFRMQNIFAQRQIGVLEDSFWSMYAKIICEIYASPGVKATWPINRNVLDHDFVEFVESCSG